MKTACLTSLTFIGSGEESYEKQVYELIESINSGTKADDFIKYKNQLLQDRHIQPSNIVENISTMSLSNLTKHANQSRAKKLGSIMGIAKRSRSIHYTECPSKTHSIQINLLEAEV